MVLVGEYDYGNHRNFDMDPYFSSHDNGHSQNKNYQKVILDLDENDLNDEDGFKKRNISPFRERMEAEKSKNQRDKLAEQFREKLESEAEERDAEIEYNKEYIESLRELWNKYKNSRQKTFQDYEPRVLSEIMKKRQNYEYPSLGWSGVGYRKRESPASYELANEALYLPDDEKRAKKFEWRNHYDDDSLPRYLFVIENMLNIVFLKKI